MKNINDVLNRLDEIILWAEQNQSPIGYFAVLYRNMTAAVQKGIAENRFEDGPRMEKLDLIFAKRYFDAFEGFRKNEAISKSWQIAFDSTKTNQIAVIQHLILGINAHINLDLAIAAAETSPKYQIQKLKNDFNQINTIISGLIDDTKLKLSKIWLPFRIFSDLLDTESDGIINFSIKMARLFSWENAEILAMAPEILVPTQITKIDNTVLLLAQKIQNPKWLTKSILWTIRMGELGTVAEKIKLLK